ncbi:MAG: lipid-A-disaccharide synthase [Pseudomonadota bacterium]
MTALGELSPPGPPADLPVPTLPNYRVTIVAGEPSGDALGGQIMAALNELTDGRVLYEGAGGDAMKAEGLEPAFPLSDTAVMGLKEVFPKIPLILRRVREVSDRAAEWQPDAVLLIDAPDFTHRIARRLSKRAPEVTVIKYVAPQVWASRPWRAKSMGEIADHLLALLPFEVPFFERFGLETTFVGHPVVERAKLVRGGSGLRDRLGLGAEVPMLCLLPGSRSNEVGFLLPVFREVVAQLVADLPNLECVLPTVPHVKERVLADTRDWPTPLALVEGTADKFAAFSGATAALAASGTVSTELALARCPTVITYKVGWFTAAVARQMITVDYVTLVNLLLKRPAIPEFLQDDCTPEALLPAIRALLTDPEARRRQVADQRKALDLLGLGDEAPSRRAAKAVLYVIHTKRRRNVARLA